MAAWVYEDNTDQVMYSTNAIWARGWDDWDLGDPNLSADVNVQSGPRAVIRDGNWDWLSASMRWHDSTATTLPSSMYLASKPSFFGANPWPWVGPTTGTTCTLPAKARFDAGTPDVVP